MSVSLVAVFIPILLMGGIVGRLFREFAVTLSVAIVVSLVVSLTTTPMMCAKLARERARRATAALYRASERAFDWLLRPLRDEPVLGAAPSALDPAGGRGHGVRSTSICTSSSPRASSRSRTPAASWAPSGPTRTSRSRRCRRSSRRFVRHRQGRSRGGHRRRLHRRHAAAPRNTGRMFIALKPLAERKLERRPRSSRGCARSWPPCPGASLFLQPVQDLRIGGRLGNARVPVHAAGRRPAGAERTGRRACCAELQKLPDLVDVSSDQQNEGLQASVVIDRDTAARLGISPQMIDDTLYDAFGQRQVSTMYTPAEPVPRRDGGGAASSGRAPRRCATSTCARRAGVQVPLSAFAHFAPSTAALAVNHQGQFPAITLSFNLRPGVALGDAVSEIDGGGAARSACRRAFAPASRARRRRSRPRWPASRC